MSAGSGEGPELRVSYMLKKSVNKRAFTLKENYKNRFFVLFPTCLKYYDGSIEKGRGREKGCVNLFNVKVVAPVNDGELDNNSNTFQVLYEENFDTFTLYIVAENEGMKKGWISSLTDVCQRINVRLATSYHPGVWSRRRGSFSCCNQLMKTATGCTQLQTEEQQAVPDGLRSLNVAAPVPPEVNNLTRSYVSSASNGARTGGTRVAMYDYSAVDTCHLDLVKGEEYTIIDTSKEHWWLAKNKKGQSGFVPANYLRKSNGLEAYAWYFRDVSRPRCEALLQAENRDGTFLVRDSVQKPGTYTLSVFSFEGNHRAEGNVKHYHIKKDDRSKTQYYIARTHVFPSIPEVINYHKLNGAGLVTRLKHIPSQHTDKPATAGSGCGIFEINPADLQILEELGTGQFGTVRKGILKGRTEVAVKMMKPQSMSEDDFIAEARTMTQLQHPNLVQLYGVCTTQPIYIVVEYMPNGALQTYLKRKRAQLLSRVAVLLEMCIQVSSAMDFLESKNVIHRDLAARNCLMGKSNVVKVCDFGLARFVTDDEYTSSQGTKFPVRWAPPEVLNFSRFSSKSDVWAFGILMWEVFTCGSTPYGRMRNHQIAEFVNEGKTCERPENCPGIVFKVMKSCWTMLPENRPGFKEVWDELESIIERDYQD